MNVFLVHELLENRDHNITSFVVSEFDAECEGNLKMGKGKRKKGSIMLKSVKYLDFSIKNAGHLQSSN